MNFNVNLTAPLPTFGEGKKIVSRPEVSFVMPCLNEVEAIAFCVEQAQRCIRENQLDAEIVVADNGSEDGSIELARSLGARVIAVSQRGMGAALIAGISAAKGKLIIMGDADGSYDFSQTMPFLKELRRGLDLVVGNRFQGGIEKGAMPFLHRYLGNPVLTGIGRLFLGVPCGDFHCGLRGLRKEVWATLNLKKNGMDFFTEMMSRASFVGLKIGEVPTRLNPAKRSRPPHLRTWADGWLNVQCLVSCYLQNSWERKPRYKPAVS